MAGYTKSEAIWGIYLSVAWFQEGSAEDFKGYETVSSGEKNQYVCAGTVFSETIWRKERLLWAIWYEVETGEKICGNCRLR